MTKKSLALMGYSNSGKSSLGKKLASILDYEVIHTIKPLYAFLARIYQVDLDWLMSQEGKRSKCGKGNKTFHDILVDMYLYHEEHQTEWGLNMLKMQLQKSVRPSIFTAIRNKNEAEFLLDNYSHSELLVVWLGRENSVIQDSETNMWSYFEKLRAKFDYLILNLNNDAEWSQAKTSLVRKLTESF